MALDPKNPYGLTPTPESDWPAPITGAELAEIDAGFDDERARCRAMPDSPPPPKPGRTPLNKRHMNSRGELSPPVEIIEALA